MGTEIIFISKSRKFLIQSKKHFRKIKESQKDRLRNYYLSYSKRNLSQNYLLVLSSELMYFPLTAVDNAKTR